MDTIQTGAGSVVIPGTYIEGTSVDLLYVQAIGALENLGAQQFRAGLVKLFRDTPALNGFTLTINVESDPHEVLIERIEVAPAASDDTRMSDLRQAVLRLVENDAAAVLYESISGKHFTRASCAGDLEGDVAVLRDVSNPSYGFVDGDVTLKLGFLTVHLPGPSADQLYVRVADEEIGKTVVVDAAFLRANPDYGIRLMHKMAVQAGLPIPGRGARAAASDGVAIAA